MEFLLVWMRRRWRAEPTDCRWFRTRTGRRPPASVRSLIAALSSRIESIEKEVADLREQPGKTSRDSSKPPSSDPPGTPPPARPPKSKNPRGGQKGHSRHSRERLPADRIVPCVPSACAHCEHPLEGYDPACDGRRLRVTHFGASYTSVPQSRSSHGELSP